MIINYRNIQSEDDWNWISKRADPTLTENTKGIVAVDTNVDYILMEMRKENCKWLKG